LWPPPKVRLRGKLRTGPANDIDAGTMGTTTSPRQQRLAKIGQQLDLIEAEMKRIGYWSAEPPDLQAKFASGEMQSYTDAPSFELWLQQIFIPNARDGVASDELPEQSQVGLMALRQYEYQSSVPVAQQLLSLLNDFDDMVERYGKS
ncbi:MAG: YqcC family protein, partial [Stenotrophobium sp.]